MIEGTRCRKGRCSSAVRHLAGLSFLRSSGRLPHYPILLLPLIASEPLLVAFRLRREGDNDDAPENGGVHQF